MRYGFAGTPQFAADILGALIAAGFSPQFVITQPDRPAGRGKRLTAPPVKEVAMAHQVPCLQPHKIDKDLIARVSSDEPQWILVVAFGAILPPDFLAIPTECCLNIHTSLLPRWRGAAPVARAIENGDDKSGITLMKISPALDSGDILSQQECPIKADDTSGSLMTRLTPIAINMLTDFFARPQDWTAYPQDESRSCYAKKISSAECQLDWELSASLLERRIRAFNPTPGCWTLIDGERVKIWRALSLEEDSQSPPGCVLTVPPAELRIQCGKGILVIKELQFPGKKISQARSLNRKLPPKLPSLGK